MPAPDSFEKFVGDLSESIGRREVAIFCGAGISQNSGLPLVRELIRTILSRLQASNADAQLVLESPLPFEAFVEILDDCSDISELLAVFEFGTPNPTHLFLAELARAGRVRLLCTTNFDSLIEQAMERLGLKRDVHFEVLHRDEDFARLRLDGPGIRVVKIHGSIDDKAQMAITMRQVAGRTLTRDRRQAIDAVFAGEPHRRVLVLGYSCSDLFDLSPQIEAIESGHREVVFVEHKRDAAEVRDLADKQVKNPFRGFGDSRWIRYDTDQLVVQLAERAHIELPERKDLATDGRRVWEQRIDAWAAAADAARPGIAAPAILGEIFLRLSHFERSVHHYARALAAARASHDRLHEGICLGNVANGEARLGRTEDAIRNYEAAIQIAREQGDAAREAMWSCNLGGLHLLSGEHECAVAVLERALKLGRECSDQATQSYAAGNIGHALYLTGRYTDANAYYLEALELARELGDKGAELSVVGSLGQIAHYLGDFRSAIDYHERALLLSRQMGDRAGECNWRGKLANDYLAVRDLDRAELELQKAIALARETRDRRAEAGRLSDLGNLQYAREEIGAAIETHQASLAIAREIGDLGGEGSCMGNLGTAYQAQGRYDVAIEHYHRAIEIAGRVGNRQLEATWLGNLGAAWGRCGDHRQAIDCFVRSLDLASQVGDRVRVANAEYNLGSSWLALGDTQDAAHHFQRALDLYTTLYGADHPQTRLARASLQELPMNAPSTLFWIQADNGNVFELRTANGKRVVPVFTTAEAALRVRALMKERFPETLRVCQGMDVPRAVFEKSAMAADAAPGDYQFIYEDSEQFQPFVAALEAYPARA